MATGSTMLPLGSALPDFTLPDAVSEKTVTSSSLRAGRKGTLVMFLCNHCPLVVHVRGEVARVAHEALALGLGVAAINSNSLRTHPQDGPEHMQALARAERWQFPFLFDRTQEVARLFRAACTPEFYVFDAAGRLAYRGQLDDSRPGNGRPVTGADLRAAIAAVAAGRAPAADQKPSIGCGIKWD